MYMADKKPEKVFGITEDESLFDKVSHQRFMEILWRSDTRIIASSRDSNSYGEFRFISVAFPQSDGSLESLTFYGNGYHECREIYLLKTWSFYRNYLRETPKSYLPKQDVIDEVASERQKLQQESELAEPPSEDAELFSILADEGDEDGALAEMQDAGIW